MYSNSSKNVGSQSTFPTFITLVNVKFLFFAAEGFELPLCLSIGTFLTFTCILDHWST